MTKRTMLLICLCSLLAACGPATESDVVTPDDTGPGGLYSDFFKDGKFDGLGHPQGSIVFEAETQCRPKTGSSRDQGWGADPDSDPAGLLCTNTAKALGPGTHVVNVRAMLERLPFPACDTDPCPDPVDVLTLRLKDSSGQVLAEQTFKSDAFKEALAYTNLFVEFDNSALGDVGFEVSWAGEAGVRIDYVEAFLSMKRLVLSPASAVFDLQADFTIEVRDPPANSTLKVFCDGQELTTLLADLVGSGVARDEQTEFRRLVTVPAASLFGDCAAPRQVLVELQDDWDVERREVIYLDAVAPCAFDDGTVRVLLTGFVPFPPNSTDPRAQSVNCSQFAVEHFDAGALASSSGLPSFSVMRLFLPVEFDAAPDLLADAISRCQPNVVIGFGQGREVVDLETTAYNLKDTSDVAGGVPDNRGVVAVATPIQAGAPRKLTSRLPLSAILKELTGEGVSARKSNNPGRYVCNNLFYRILRATGTQTVAGFIHLPHLSNIGAEEQQTLQTVVEAGVKQALLSRSSW